MIETRKLSMSFGGVDALQDVGMAVAAGEIRGIIGPNGAGKTTLVNCIAGVNRPSRGDVLLGGQSLLGLKASAVAARGLRRTFQTTQLFRGLTVLENVMVGCHEMLAAGPLAAAFGTKRLWADERLAAAKAREVLDFVGMSQFADRDGGELSFGQQRMIEIARAIIGDPRVLLLDEPAVGLSPDRVQDLEILIRRIRDERGVTVLMIEHVIRLVMNVCDRITVLSSGRTIAEGTADEITRNEVVIEAYLGRELNADRPQP